MKKPRLTIFRKILLCASVLVFGYALSMVQGHLSGRRVRHEFHRMSESLFPSAIGIREALNEFRKAVRLFENAILEGYPEYIEEARRSGETADVLFDEIARMEGQAVSLSEVVERLSGMFDASNGRERMDFESRKYRKRLSPAMGYADLLE
jgi:predicted nuclease with RNAse H fold